MDPLAIIHTRFLSDVYRLLETSIQEVAVLGRVASARDLYNLLKTNTTPQYCSVYTAGLYFGWAAADTWPDSESEERRTETAQQNHRDLVDESMLWPQRTKGSQRTDDEEGLDRCLEMVDEDAVDVMGRMEYVECRESCAALVKALDLALILAGREPERKGLDIKSQQLFGRLSRRLHYPTQIHCLSFAYRIWPLLLDGVLAKAAGVREAKLDAMIPAIETAFRQRLQRGRRSPFPSSTSLEELIRTWTRPLTEADDQATIRTQFAGASSEEIQRLEKRLGIELPADYKTFLSFSNGVDSGRSRVLHKLQDVRLVTEVGLGEVGSEELSTQLLDCRPTDLWCEERGVMWVHDGFVWPGCEGMVEIGDSNDRKVWLMPPNLMGKLRDNYLQIHEMGPDRVKWLVSKLVENFAGSMEKLSQLEWCCLTWVSLAEGGVRRCRAYPSFRSFVEDMACKSSFGDGRGSIAYACR